MRIKVADENKVPIQLFKLERLSWVVQGRKSETEESAGGVMMELSLKWYSVPGSADGGWGSWAKEWGLPVDIFLKR